MHKKYQRFLKYINGNFLIQVTDLQQGEVSCWTLFSPLGGEGNAPVQPLLQMVELEILMAMRMSCSKLTTLDLRRANFGLFKDLLGKVSWVKALEGRGCLGMLSGIQGSPPPISETMHAKKEQIRQILQEVSMDKELLSKLRT